MTDSYAGFHPAGSPLFMAVHDPALHQFIAYLAEKKAQQEAHPGEHLRIELQRAFITRVRESFRQSILDGELRLHLMSHLLSGRLLEGEFELHSNVIGILPGGEKRPFLIRERIDRENLFSHTDLDLGNQMLAKFRYRTNGTWHPLVLSANFVEYLPLGRPETGVNRITSRVKAEEDLWNKVTDEIFGLDQLLQRDKHLRQYSKYIKDIFGLKIVCESDDACLQVHESLARIRRGQCDWSVVEHAMQQGNLRTAEEGDRLLLEFVETKNYLTCDTSQMKKTGWRALKSVVRWQDQLLEIQVQPLWNYYQELDHMAGPSHHSFKLLRDSVREEIAGKVPLYGFYRDLLKMLFLDGGVTFNRDNASVVITD